MAQPFLILKKCPTKQVGETAVYVLTFESALPLKMEEGSFVWWMKSSRTDWKTSIKAHRDERYNKLRKQKAELPFGHMKRNSGAGQFLVRGKAGVNAELSILSTVGIPLLILKLGGI